MTENHSNEKGPAQGNEQGPWETLNHSIDEASNSAKPQETQGVSVGNGAAGGANFGPRHGGGKRYTRAQAEYLAQTQGGSPEDYLSDAHEAHIGSRWAYRDGEHAHGEPTGVEYVYRDASGVINLVKSKFEKWENGVRVSKAYPIKHYIGLNGDEDNPTNYKWGYGDHKQTLYFLNFLAARPKGSLVAFCEGEKDAETACDIFGAATSTIEGAAGYKNGRLEGWREDYAAALAGHDILILGDADAPGRAHVYVVARKLIGVARSVRIVRNWDGHKDVTEWVEAHIGCTVAEAIANGMWTREVLDDLKSKIEARAVPFVGEVEELIEIALKDHPLLAAEDMSAWLAEMDRERPEQFLRFWQAFDKEKTLKGKKSAINKAVSRQSKRQQGGGDNETQADVLLRLAKEAELFHAPNGEAFADVQINGHRETWAVNSTGFKNWLRYKYLQSKDGAPSSETFTATINAISAKAQFEATERKVFVRTAGHDGKIYLDLCDEDWRAIEIDTDGWRIVSEPPVRFKRAKGMLPLPLPQNGGSVKALKDFVNATDENFILAVAFLLMALKDDGPYIILVIMGEHGSAKTTFAKILRLLIDPNEADLRTLPKDDRDAAISANNSHLQLFDNVSHIQPWLSDTLCRLATNSGFATRQLHTDAEEVIFNGRKPIILNGIDGFVTRADLADRCLMVKLKSIPEDARKLENEIMSEFEKAAPMIFGALLDVISHGLGEMPRVKIDKFPRMADFYKWIKACEGALTDVGDFEAAYGGNRVEMAQRAVDADMVATAIMEIIEKKPDHIISNKSCKDLFEALASVTNSSDRERPNSKWPQSERGLQSRLTHLAPTLRTLGITIEAYKDPHTKTNKYNFYRNEEVAKSEGAS